MYSFSLFVWTPLRSSKDFIIEWVDDNSSDYRFHTYLVSSERSITNTMYPTRTPKIGDIFAQFDCVKNSINHFPMIKIAAIGTSQCCCVNRSGIECTVCHFKVGSLLRFFDLFYVFELCFLHDLGIY